MPGSGDTPTVAGVPITIDRLSEVPAYQQLAAEIRRLIAERALPVDEDTGKMRVPSIHDLIRETGLAQNTILKAVGLLRAEGLVVRVPGRGVFVK